MALDLARLMLAKAALLGRYPADSVSLASRAVALAERAVLQEGRLDLARGLADVYLDAVAVLQPLGGWLPACFDMAGAHCASAIRILEEIERSSDPPDLLLPLAEARLCRLALLRRSRGADVSVERDLAVAALSRLERERDAHWVEPLVRAL
jgi:hypothetical protein